jgi:hypothetical protein
MLQSLLTHVLEPPHLHTAILFTPAGELVAFAVGPGRSKDEIRILVGITGEVWRETREQGCGMVESDVSMRYSLHFGVECVCECSSVESLSSLWMRSM